MKDGEQWLMTLPAADRKLLATPGLTPRQLWQLMSEQGRKVIRLMVRDSQAQLAKHQAALDEWIVANYVRLPDGKLERKPKVRKPKPSVFDSVNEED